MEPMKVSPLDPGGTSSGSAGHAIGNLRTLNELSPDTDFHEQDFHTLNDVSWRTWNEYSAGSSLVRHAKGKAAGLDTMEWFRKESSDSPKMSPTSPESPPNLPALGEGDEPGDDALDLGSCPSIAEAELRAFNEMSWRTWNELSSSELHRGAFLRNATREPPKRAGLDSLDWWTLGEHDASSPQSAEPKIAEDGACSTVSDSEMRAFNELSWRTWNEMSYSADMLSNLGRPALLQASCPPGLDAMEFFRSDIDESTEADSKRVDQASSKLDSVFSGQTSPPAGMDDEPLRVEVGEAARPQQPKFPSPGSIGHPELCTRPCLYFAAGTCANKDNCDFCHLSHPRRPARLDKRHRERFDKLSRSERVAVVMPVLLEKAQVAGLPQVHVQPVLDRLRKQCAEIPEQADSIRVSKSLLQALAAMNLRSLLIMLDEAPVLGAPVAGMSLC